MKPVFISLVILSIAFSAFATITQCQSEAPHIGLFDPDDPNCFGGIDNAEIALNYDASRSEYDLCVFGGVVYLGSDANSSGVHFPAPQGACENLGIDYVIKITTLTSGNTHKASVSVETAHSRLPVTSASLGLMESASGACGLVYGAMRALPALMNAIDTYEKKVIADGVPYASSPDIRVFLQKKEMNAGDSVQVKFFVDECRLNVALPGRTLRLSARGGEMVDDSIVLDDNGQGEAWFKAGSVPGAVSVTATLNYVYEPSNRNKSAKGSDFGHVGPPPDCYEVYAWVSGKKSDHSDTTKVESYPGIVFQRTYKTNSSTSYSASLHGWITYSEDGGVTFIYSDDEEWKARSPGGCSFSQNLVVSSGTFEENNFWTILREQLNVSTSDTSASLLFEYDPATGLGMIEVAIPMSGTRTYSTADGDESSPTGGSVSFHSEAIDIAKIDSSFSVSGEWDTAYAQKLGSWDWGTIHYTESKQFGATLRLVKNATALVSRRFKRVSAVVPRIRYLHNALFVKGLNGAGLQIELFDVRGRVAFHEATVPIAGQEAHQIKLPRLAGGYYIALVKNSMGQSAQTSFFLER